MKTSFLLGILLAAGAGTDLSAQTVTGKVIDMEQKPVDAATVILQLADSTFADAAITDTAGVFSFNACPEHYRLIVQHMLYQTMEREGSGEDAGTFTLTPKDYALEEVVVKGERPLVKVEGSRLTYDMPRLTANRLVTNAYEALLQLPGVMEKDGLPSLAGTGSLSIVLNGKPSSMTEEQLISLLKSMPASRVERAEVMYSAPPQYHVRGAAINLVLKGYKAGEGGLQGEVNGSYIQKDEGGGNGGAALTWLSEKWDADVMYNLKDEYVRQGFDFSALHTVKDKTHDIRLSDNGEIRNLTHTFRAGATYRPDEKNSISLSYTGSISPDRKSYMDAWGNVTDSHNDKRSDVRLHNASLNYTSGFGLSAGADYTYYGNKDSQNFSDTDAGGNTTAFRSDSRQRIDRWKVYADQSHALPEAWKLNYGAAFTYVNDRNSQLYDLPEMTGLNNESRIDEYTYNLYAGFEKAFNPQWSLSASAAVEYYRMTDYKKWAVYPNLSLNYMPSASHVLQLSFSSDKTYPDYWTLSGTTSYLNGYQVSEGNAYLRPYADYTASLTYIMKSKYIFQASYSYVPDYFMQMTYLDSDELRAVYNFQNWDFIKLLTFTAVIPFKAGAWWDSRLTLNAQLKHDKASHYYDAPFDNRRWAGIGQWTSTFTLSRHPDIRLEISAFGQTGIIQGSYRSGAIGYVDAALRYTFAGDKAMIQVKGTDLFNGLNHIDIRSRNGSQHFDMNVRSYAQSFSVAFSYKFGGYKKKATKDIDTSRFGM